MTPESKGAFEPKKRRHGRRRIMVIGQYTCGCSYGPVPKRERLEYCGDHGGDIQDEYPVSPTKKKERE